MPAGVHKTASSRRPRLSADGRYIVFETKSNLIATDKDDWLDVYLYDRVTKTHRRLAGTDPTRSNGEPSISHDGKTIAFRSYMKPTEKNLPPKFADIFLYDRIRDHYELVTDGLDGKPQDGECLGPVLSLNNRYVLFTSNATNLSPLQKDPLPSIYLFDHKRKTYELVSRTDTNSPANRISGDPKMSVDAHVIVFKSAATNLVRLLPLNSLAFHLYLYNRDEGSMIRIDEEPRGFNPDEYNIGQFDMDDRGRVIVFEGRARQVINPSEALQKSDLFLFDAVSSTVTKFTSGLFSESAHAPSMSGDGRYVAFLLYGPSIKKEDRGIIVYDRQTNVWRKAVAGACRNPILSRNGRLIVFESDDPILNNTKKDDTNNIFTIDNPFLEP